jgi:hypothetical protein
MRTFLMLAAFAIACTDEPDPALHAEVTCAAGWPQPTPSPRTCEAACESVPANQSTIGIDPCNAKHGDLEYMCPSSFEFMGVRGCCAPDEVDYPAPVPFFECR